MTRYFDIDFDTVLSGTIKGSDMPPKHITWDQLQDKIHQRDIIPTLLKLATDGRADVKVGNHTMAIHLLHN